MQTAKSDFDPVYAMKAAPGLPSRPRPNSETISPLGASNLAYVPPSDVTSDPAIRMVRRATDGKERGKALAEWWVRWETLPELVRDRPAAEVLAEDRRAD